MNFYFQHIYVITSLSLFKESMLGLYMSLTGSYLALWVHWGPSLQEKVHVHSYGQLLVNVESSFHR